MSEANRHRSCAGCLDGCVPGMTNHCASCVHESWPCDAQKRGDQLMGAAAEVHRFYQHNEYGSSFLDCEFRPCATYREALGLPLHGRSGG